jgi:riboflavin-specific deaminase-like protein
VDAHGYAQSLQLDAPPERPYVIVNFVASIDGHTTVDDRSRKLSDPADRQLFYALRERVDAVLAGTNTLEAEQYKRMLPQVERRERRVVAGLSPEPLATTITRSGRLPLGIPLFAEPEARVVVFSPIPPVTARLAATVVHAPQTTLVDALRSLRRDHGVRTLLCEGGALLFGALLRAGLVDELFMTLAPRLVGGTSGPAVVSGPPPEAPVDLNLLGALEHQGTMFMRYAVSTV